MNKPFYYWNKGLEVAFDHEKRTASRVNLGTRLKELRTKRGLSQTELAKLVGVTSSTISQVESNQIYPSLPALIKMAEILSVDVSSFLKELEDVSKRVVFPGSGAVEIQFPNLPRESISGKLMTPVDFEPKAEPYIIEIPPGTKLPSHFFIHKGEEIGYLLSGKLQLKLEKTIHAIQAGDLVYLTSETPSRWENPGAGAARLLWLKIR